MRALHVAVARAGDAAGRERDLHQARAIDAEAGLAAPQIRHADEALGNGDEIRCGGVERRKMVSRHVAARCQPRQLAVFADDGDAAAQRQSLHRLRLD